MRGVISAGMVSGLETLGLLDTFDVVFGTSAGAVTGAYFVARQAKLGATIIYEDINSSQFIDPLRILRRRPVVNLDFLFADVMVRRKPLDWQAVTQGPIPLKVVVSSVDELKAEVLENFASKEELLRTLRASTTLPVAAGPPTKVHGRRYLDGGLFEPIPINSATQYGCTHVLVLLTRPLGRGPNILLHRLLVRPLLERIKRGLGKRYMEQLRLYSQTIADILYKQANPHESPFVYAICLPEGSAEVPKLEKESKKLRQGAIRAMEITLKTFNQRDGIITDTLTGCDQSGREIDRVPEG